MPDPHAVVPRASRRRRHASLWRGAWSWLDLTQVKPGRASLHIAVLSVGIAGAVATAATHRPAVSPTIEVAPAVVADRPEPDGAEPQTTAEAAAPVTVAPQLTTYTVQPGDTLKTVAEKFGVSVATLVAANKLDDPDLITVGQELIVLPTNGILHTLAPGETLGQVAARYGVAPDAIASANRVAAVPDEPLGGDKVVVPGVEPTLPPARPKQRVVRSAAPAQQEARSSSDEEPSFASVTILPDADGDQAAEAAKPSPSETTDKPSRARSPVIYEVQEGDSLRSLAAQFGVSIQTILLANDIPDPDLIKVGTKLKVLPVSGVEHEVKEGESLADIAAAYKVDLGPIIDFNGLENPDMIRVGDKLIIPGATARVAVPTAATASAPAPAAESSSGSAAAAAAGAAAPAAQPAAPAAASKPAAPAAAASAQVASKPAAKPETPAIAVPAPASGAGGSGIVKNAMAYLGSRYVFGGSSPAGFDCSGFVWYVYKVSGINISRGLWGQLNGGPRISRENLQPGDLVFFANTYMPGLSHVGIYIGGGRFIHAIDESRGVGISNLSDAYWASRYVGATRPW